MNTRKEDPRARRGRPPSLSRERVATVALELVDRDGLDALTMPRLARALGVGTMTLYGYVSSKDDLLDAVVDAAVEGAAVGGAAPPSGRHGNWRDAVRQVAHVAHDLLTRHPALVAIRLQKPVLRPEALRFGERAMGLLIEAGFDAEQAASAFRLLFTYVFGFAGLSPAAGAVEARRQAAVAVAGLSPEEHPVLTSNLGPFAHAMAGEDEFDFGLDRILDGLEAHLRGASRTH